MAKPIIRYGPFVEGVDYMLPRQNRKYVKLDNTIISKGKLRKRPGLHQYGPFDRATGENPSSHTALLEFDTNLGVPWVEQLVPTGTTSSDWTIVGGESTDHESVDEIQPDDDTTYITEGTFDGASIMTFANLSETRDYVAGLELYIRARVQGVDNTVGAIEIINGSTTIAVANVTVASNSESDQWQDIYIDLPINKVTGLPWTSTEVDGLSLTYKMIQPSPPLSPNDVAILQPGAAGAHTDFTGSVNDIVDGISWIRDSVDVTDGSMTSTTAGNKQSVAVANPPTTFWGIDNVTIDIRLWRDQDQAPAQARFYLRGSDSVDRQIGTDLQVYNSPDYPAPSEFRGVDRVEIVLTENPETSTTWTDSDLDDIQIVVEHLGGGKLYWGGADAHVNGNTGGVIEMTTTNVLAWGWDTGAREPIPQLQLQSRGATRINKPSSQAFTSIGTNITIAGLPAVKASYTYFTQLAWATNGIDQMIYYPDANDLWVQLSGKPIGQYIESYGGRLVLADVTESGTRNAERIRWSKILDGTDWSASTSGQLDIHDTPGRFTGLKKYLGSLIAYKELGIYELIVQPDVIQPYRHYLRDPHHGCRAGATLQVASIKGSPAQIFFGDGPSGLSVYAFLGSETIELGAKIRDEIAERVDYNNVEYSFAVVDPQSQMYLLFIPDTGNYYVNKCWAYHIPTETWREWTFGQKITAAGVGTIPMPDPNSISTNVYKGRRTAIFAGIDGLIYWLNRDMHLDMVGGGDANPDNWSNPNRQPAAVDTQPLMVNIPMKIEVEIAHPEKRPISGVTVHLWYRDRGPCQVQIYTSVDAGVTFTQQGLSYGLGTEDEVGDLVHARMSFDIDHADTATLRIVESTGILWREGDLDIVDMAVEFDSGGESA